MTAVTNKKVKKLCIISRQTIENRITTALFLFMTEPVSERLCFDLPFIQSVKEQIFVLQTKLKALRPLKGFRRSTCMSKEVKKLKGKIKRLLNYFVNSTMIKQSRRRKFRKANTHGKLKSRQVRKQRTQSHLFRLCS